MSTELPEVTSSGKTHWASKFLCRMNIRVCRVMVHLSLLCFVWRAQCDGGMHTMRCAICNGRNFLFLVGRGLAQYLWHARKAETVKFAAAGTPCAHTTCGRHLPHIPAHTCAHTHRAALTSMYCDCCDMAGARHNRSGRLAAMPSRDSSVGRASD